MFELHSLRVFEMNYIFFIPLFNVEVRCSFETLLSTYISDLCHLLKVHTISLLTQNFNTRN